MSRSRRDALAGLLFALPAVALFVAFFVVPLALTVWMSLHEWPLLGEHAFEGLGNYREVLDDDQFRHALLFTLEFAALVVPLLFTVGMGLALLFQRARRGVALFRTAVFIPVSLGFAAASYLWLALLNPRVGLVDELLVDVGIVDDRIDWFAQSGRALVVVVLVTVWKLSGFSMVVLMNGMQAIPDELEDAAKVDGAGAWRRFTAITLPLMRKPIAFVLTFLLVAAFLTFDQFYILTGGGPSNSTITGVYWIYNSSFIQGDLGVGAAMSVVFLLALLFFTGAQLFLMRGQVDK